MHATCLTVLVHVPDSDKSLQATLDKPEGFCSHYGADHYGLPRNEKKITLEKKSWTVPMSYTFGKSVVRPIRAGEAIEWSIV